MLKPVVDEQMAVRVLVVVVTTIEVLVEVPIIQEICIMLHVTRTM